MPMRYLSGILLFSLILIISISSVRAEVYLNKQWDEHLEDWVTSALSLEGRGLSIDREYQNAYGYFMELDPGPPFIIERDIVITNVMDEDERVIDWGSFYVRTDGAGSVPFELIFLPPTSEPLMIRTSGHLYVTGTPSDRVIFKGAYGIKSGDWTDSAESDRDTYHVEFSYCSFDSVGRYGTCAATLLNFGGGHVSLDNCRFSEFGYDAVSRVVDGSDRYYLNRTQIWGFSMTECVFRNLNTWGRYTVYLNHLDKVKIVGNHFENVEFFPFPPQSALVEANNCVLRDLRGNTGSGNTINVIRMDGGVRDVNCQLQSSSQIPFLVGRIDVEADRTLSIGEGSVLKMTDVSSNPNFNIYGRMTVESAVLTSFEDDKFGGDTDLAPEPSTIQTWGYNSGIYVYTNGSLSMLNSTVRYAQGGIDSRGDAVVDGCLFQYNNGGFGCVGTGYNIYEITNSTFLNNAGSGVSFTNMNGLVQELVIDNIVSVNNRRGHSLNCGYSNPAEISISRSIFSGNENPGIYLDIGTGITGLSIDGCIISGNGESGIQAYDLGGNNAPLRVESCVLAGNGYYELSSITLGHGAGIRSGDLEFINNTVSFNHKLGLWHELDDGAQSRIANNVFSNNLDDGYSKDDDEIPWFGNNIFHDNDGNYEMWFATGTGDIRTVEELQALGGIYATNQDVDPSFAAEVSGIADSVGYVEKKNRSVIVHSGLDPAGTRVDHMIIKPDKNEERWFFIENEQEDTLFISGDITALAEAGDTFRIFDHHLDWSSTLVDAGNTASVQGTMDIDGDLRLIDGDGSTLADVDIGADEFNPDTFTVIVLSPVKDDLWMPGETYSIEWSSVGIDSLSISYAVEYDPQDVEYHEVVASVPASERFFQWTVPDELSAKCRILIEDVHNQNRRAESGLFRIKGYDLTRFDPEMEYYPFIVDRDGWNIWNSSDDMWPESWWSRFDYENGNDPNTGRAYPFYFSALGFLNAEPSDFPDWPLFAGVFGLDRCYISTPGGLDYRPSAVQKWASIKETWKGSCLGFALSSLMAFDDKVTFLTSYPGVDSFDSLYALPLDDDHRETINGISLHQFGSAYPGRVDTNYTKNPGETLEEIRAMLLDETRDDRWLFLGNNYGSGAHAVVPWKIEKSTGFPEFDSIFVYDSNVPGDLSAKIVVSASSNSWYYEYLSGWGGGSRLYLMDRASNYFSRPVLSAGGTSHISGSLEDRSLTIGAVPGFVELYNSAGASIDIRNGVGNTVGYSDSSIHNTVPGAFPFVPVTGSFHPPIGFLLPEDSYTVTMSEFPEPEILLSLFTDSLVFSCVRNDAVSTQTDRVNCTEVFTIVNPDAVTKSVSSKLSEAVIDGEREFSLLNFSIDQNDSVSIEPPVEGSMKFVNHGTASSYALGLRIVSGSENGIFEHADLVLPATSSHTIVPSWNDLKSIPVKILIDSGNNGSIDDSLFVDNQYVATLLQFFGSGYRGEFIEIEWRLSQLDNDVVFSVLRADGVEEDFIPMPWLEIQAHELYFRVIDAGIEPGREYRYQVRYELDGRSRVLFETEVIRTPVLPLTLFQNYPNPFNPATTIRYFLPDKAAVQIDIYDVSGRRISRLVEKTQSAGYHVAVWNGRNHNGRSVGAGVYFYRLTSGKKTLARKMVLLR